LPLPAATAETPLVLGARMAILGRRAEEHVRSGRAAEAAQDLSWLIAQELEAPWPADRETLARWSRLLAEAQVGHRWSKDGPWPSLELEVRSGDSLEALCARARAQRTDLLLCSGILERANQVGRYIHPGDRIRVPLERVHVLVDLSARWLLYLHGDEIVCAWEIAVGRPESPTIPGRYRVGEKLTDPPWFRKGGPVVPFGDEENLLGTRWIAWEGSESLGFHGTWEPESIGTAASDGCVRLRNEDVEELFEILPRGAAIEVRP
jgi:hypothetical protein